MTSTQPISNDTLALAPVTSFDGPVLEFDFPSFQIGIAEYPEGPTGSTVFYFPQGACTAIDIRGGSHATFFTEPLHNGELPIHAICLSGGSFFGLEAAAGVAAEIFAKRGYCTSWGTIPLVSGAIIYDFVPRANSIYPDKELGRAALRAAVPNRFPLHQRGAGVSATVGKWLRDPYHYETGGQGGAFAQVGDVKVAVFTIVNAVGAILDRQGKVVRGHLDKETGKRARISEVLGGDWSDFYQGAAGPPKVAPVAPEPGNTTLSVVITNQKLAPWPLRQLGKQVHASMARAIEPFHTISDGDILYVVSTGEVEPKDLKHHQLAYLASELAWDAILNSY